MKIRLILALLCAASALALAPSARAQDAAPAQPDAPKEAPAEAKDEPVTSSTVAGITLPAGAPSARRVSDKAAVTALSDQLEKLAARLNIPLGEPEVLSWSGKSYKRENSKDIVAGITGTLKEAGFAYATMGAPMAAPGSTTTLFTASNDGKKSMLMGYWVESDQMLVLVWAALEAPDADAFPGQPEAPAQPAPPAK